MTRRSYINPRTRSKKKQIFSAQIALAVTYLKNGNYEEATEFSNLIKSNTVHEESIRTRLVNIVSAYAALYSKASLLEKIYELEDAKKTEEALTIIEQLLENYPDDVKILLLKATLLQKLEKYCESIVVFMKVLEKGENFAARYGLVLSWLYLEEFDNANNNACDLRSETDEQKKQIAELLKSIYETKTNWVIRKAYKFSEKHAYECAERFLSKYLAQDPDNDSIRLALARMYGYDSLFEKGLEQTFFVIRKNPNSREAWELTADLFSWRGNYLLSLQIYRALLSQKYSDSLLLGIGYPYLYLNYFVPANWIAIKLSNCDLYTLVHEDTFLRFPYPMWNLVYRHLQDSQSLRINKESAQYLWQCRNCLLDLTISHLDAGSPGFGGFLDQAIFGATCPINLVGSLLQMRELRMPITIFI